VSARFPIVPGVAAENILALAQAEGWTPKAVLEARADSPFQVVWATAAGIVTYVHDAVLDVGYFQVDGPSTGVIEQALRSCGLIFSTSEVAEMAEACETPQELLAVTCYVGIAADEHPDPGLLRALQRALGDPHPEVRCVAVMASAYARWPQLLPRLEQIERSDPDAKARDLAASIRKAAR
jgi:hypothetical protein